MRRSFFAGVMTLLSLAGLASAAAGQAPPPGTLHRAERGQPLDPCPRTGLGEGAVFRDSKGPGFTVDSCGRKVSGSGELPQIRAGSGTAAHVTIDRMTTRSSFGSHAAGGTLTLLGSADVYTLSNGSSWSSGAGSYVAHAAPLDHVEESGTTLRYVLSAPASGLIYQQTDYDSGDHSAQGTLAPSGALVLEAETGSTTAVLRGEALLVSNEATWYGEPRFNFYTAIVGSVVPFELTYTMQGSTWTADAFDRAFSYTVAGFVDFAHPVSTPRAVSLSITGPPRVPDGSTTRFTATVLYESGAQRDVSATAAWTVSPPELASAAGGLLTTGTVPADTELTLRATAVVGEDSLAAEKQVRILADATAEQPGTWPMFQANAQHTGYLETAVTPETFRLKWQRNVGNGRMLNPVAAGDGKVFVTLLIYFNDITTLFALDAADGATLWSKGFGDIFSVNPPSYAYGNVYVQTGNHASDTWLRAFDGATGDVVFQAPHAAQWERYFAPTIYDGKAYINGGTYGGMYGFDAFSGDQLWFASLPQYDQWTPAVDAGRAYAYVGDYTPGLYVRDRATGNPAYFVADPAFDWNGWSMNLAPVLGGHDDVIAIHDGRLISFDTASHAIRWEVQGQYTGQPSLAHERIYAIDGGRLRVLDELTHAELWSWQAGDGNLTGPMIVTDRHVFVTTSQRVHAVDLTARQSVWSYPVAGHLAIADGTLYVASADGRLTAFASPTGMFHTVPPCRAVDTRLASGVPNGAPALSGGVLRTLAFAGACGVPATATAVSVNITVTGAGAPGELRLSASTPAPALSTLSYSLGQTRANNAIVALGPDGALAALADQSAGSTVHLIVDVNGYFE